MSKLTKPRLDLYLEQIRVLGNNAVERVIEAEKRKRVAMEHDFNSQYAAEIGRINRQAKELLDSERALIDDLARLHGKSLFLCNDSPGHGRVRAIKLREDRHRDPRFSFETEADASRKKIRAIQARATSEMLMSDTTEYANHILMGFEEEMRGHE